MIIDAYGIHKMNNRQLEIRSNAEVQVDDVVHERVFYVDTEAGFIRKYVIGEDGMIKLNEEGDAALCEVVTGKVVVIDKRTGEPFEC